MPDDERSATARSRWERLHPWIASLLLLVASGNLIRVPYYSIGPGPATDVLELIDVQGVPDYPSDGDLLLTTASISRGSLTVFEYVWTLVDPQLELIPSELIQPPGSSEEDVDEQNRVAMDNSKLEAELAAYAALGFKRVPGARILTVVDGAAADGILAPNDLVVGFQGEVINTPARLVKRIGEYAPGDRVAMTVVRDGIRTQVHVVLGELDGDPKLGVTLLPAFDHTVDVDIDTQRIGGPSGGLVFALALVELLGEEDLTRGRTVAVTGQIAFQDGRGIVGPIGGIREKIRGAVQAGASLFLVPLENEQEALSVAPEGMRIVGVGTLDEAIAALRAD